ncbi:hypothetical protein [Kibdelosporangium phytohabitans]|uniref:Uncharacterized protein n=1 Tax=Kibdelosporangium phytohabitans TaxID=860235 RepID=A0A0N9HUL5_9PSEU|nr:hypothetical protein [Kibdelosporangium phytohabitans]ALG08904.1 hypothetical protein AOZ06_20065 [Kibdelosporangium phytohabitans]MBE1469941.1 hypothetical protein [Kibdelosporangium phytohabitans]
MSDDVVSVIPADPHWQPGKAAAGRAAALAATLTPGDDVRIETTWHDRIAVIDCAENLQRITCPACHASIGIEWFADLLEHNHMRGFDALDVTVPCCGAETTLDAIGYDWPCGFARFEIAIWTPDRDWFTDAELAGFAEALGHPVRQVLAHI